MFTAQKQCSGRTKYCSQLPKHKPVPTALFLFQCTGLMCQNTKHRPWPWQTDLIIGVTFLTSAVHPLTAFPAFVLLATGPITFGMPCEVCISQGVCECNTTAAFLKINRKKKKKKESCQGTEKYESVTSPPRLKPWEVRRTQLAVFRLEQLEYYGGVTALGLAAVLFKYM